MDERKNRIRDIESKRLADIKARDLLLAKLGELVFQRIGDADPFEDSTGDSPGGVLAEFRGLRQEIGKSEVEIVSLEEELSRLKELELEISSKDEEKTLLEKDFTELCGKVGAALLGDPDFHEVPESVRLEERNLLDKINEQETKLSELERGDGNIFAWLRKNARMTLSKTLLSKNRLALGRLYRAEGERFVSSEGASASSGGGTEFAGKALELKERLSALDTELAMLRSERRSIGDISAVESSPSRRIQGVKKHIEQVNAKFPALHLRMGSLAVLDGSGELLSPFLSDEDKPLIEDAELRKSAIEAGEKEIAKLKAAINIDAEKAAIEKMDQAIAAQRQKIVAAEEAIADIEKQIAGTERHIQELQAFIDNNGGV